MYFKKRIIVAVSSLIILGVFGYIFWRQYVDYNQKLNITIEKTEKLKVPVQKRWKFIKNSQGISKAVILQENNLGVRKTVEDVREYQHGIDFIEKGDGNFIMIWASSGDGLKPIGARSDGEWIHDIYYSSINRDKPSIEPIKIIKAPLAQEPASSAINTDGHIMITMEDAWRAKNTLGQTFGVYDEQMEAIQPYQQMAFDGGHSGHVTSVGDKFVIFYSNEWIDGGGVDNLGSGDDILMNIYDTRGKFIDKQNVAVGNKTRDWWPLVAGSEDRVFLLWQRFVNNKKYVKLMFSIYDVENNTYIKNQIVLKEKVEYYTYDVQYLKEINRFLVVGTDKEGKGFVFLISKDGEIIVQKYIPVAIVRESQPATKELNQNEIKVIYPASLKNLLALSITKNSVIIDGVVDVGYQWETAGTDGIFMGDNTVYFNSLSPKGIKELNVKLYEKNKLK